MEDSRAALGDRSCQRMPISADTLPPFPVPGNNIANSCLPWDIILSGWRGETQRRACNPIKASRRRLRRCCCCSCCCCSLDGAKASCFYTRPLRMEPPLSLFRAFLHPLGFSWSFRCWFSRSSTAYVTSAQRAPCNFFYDLPRFSTLWAGPSPRDCNLIRSRATSWNRWS